MLGFLLLLSLYITFTKGFTPLLAVPLGLFPIVAVNLNTIKNLKLEKQKRSIL